MCRTHMLTTKIYLSISIVKEKINLGGIMLGDKKIYSECRDFN